MNAASEDLLPEADGPEVRAAQGPAGGESPAQTVLNTKPLFKLMVEKKASDLFFTANAPIKIKIEGQIFPVNKNVLTPEVVRQTALGLMSQEQRDRFAEELEIDFAISRPGLGRFRVNIFMQRGYPAVVLRYITADMPRLESLNLPEVMRDLIMLRRGLVLVVGATGSGQVHHHRSDDQSSQTKVPRITSSPSRIRSNSCTPTSAPL